MTIFNQEGEVLEIPLNGGEEKKTAEISRDELAELVQAVEGMMLQNERLLLKLDRLSGRFLKRK